MRLLAKQAYFQQLIKLLTKLRPGQRAILAVMVIDARFDLVNDLLDAVADASKRGAEITLQYDHHSYMHGMVLALGHGFGARKYDLRNRRLLKRIKELEAAGVRLVLTNPPKTFLSNRYGGRCHMKYAVFGEVCYLGGCNFDDPSFIDHMLEIRSPKVAAALTAITDKLRLNPVTGEAFADQEVVLDDHMSLLIDAGRPNNSLIMDKALSLIANAKKRVAYAGQTFPSGSLALSLDGALARRVKVNLRITSWAHHSFPVNLQQLYTYVRYFGLLDGARYKWQKRHQPYLHDKILVADERFIIGSHNFSVTGVKYGTAEIALQGDQADVARQLYTFTTED